MMTAFWRSTGKRRREGRVAWGVRRRRARGERQRERTADRFFPDLAAVFSPHPSTPLTSPSAAPLSPTHLSSQKRLAELKAAADAPPASTTGTQPVVSRADYIQRVTRASETAPVLALLVREGGPATGAACSDAVAALAAFASSPAGRGVTCVKVEADEAAAGPGRLPDAALPTLLVYSGGTAVAKLTGGPAMGAAGGGRITPASILKAVRAAAPGVVGGGEGGRAGSSSDEEE